MRLNTSGSGRQPLIVRPETISDPRTLAAAARPGHSRRRRRLGAAFSRFLRGALLAVAVITAASDCGAGSPAGTASDPLSRGLQAHLAGRLDEATAAYFEALRQDPRNKFAYFDLGQIAHISNRPVEAESYYRLALEIDPGFGPALFNLAILRVEAGSAQEAIDLYQTLLAANPDYAAAHYNLGVALRSIGKQREGDVELARALRLDPTLPPPASAPGPAASH